MKLYINMANNGKRANNNETYPMDLLILGISSFLTSWYKISGVNKFNSLYPSFFLPSLI